MILQHRAAAGGLQPDTHDRLRATVPDRRQRRLAPARDVGPARDRRLDARTRSSQALADRDEYVRAWAVQLLAEERDAVAGGARTVRRHGARRPVAGGPALSRRRRCSGLRPAPALAASPRRSWRTREDADDHNLPKMIWLGVEPLVAQDPARALERASSGAHARWSRGSSPAARRRRRARDAGRRPSVARPTLQAQPARGAARRPRRPRRRTGAGRLGRRATRGCSAADGAVGALAGEVAQQFGDTEAAERAPRHRDARGRADCRTAAWPLQTPGGTATPGTCRRAARPAGRSRAARRRRSARSPRSTDEPLGRLLLERYPTFSAAEKAEAIQTLASRPSLRPAADATRSPMTPCRAATCRRTSARQLLRVVGSGFVEVWGPVEQSANDEQAYAGTAVCSPTRP